MEGPPFHPDTYVHVGDEVIDVGREYAAVVRPYAGAVSFFIGTTRDSFDGRVVLRLEYEAYGPMARAVLGQLVVEAREAAGGVLAAVRLVHRTGLVPVGEASLLIAVSAPHRGQALTAVQALLEGVKARAPVWKKEVYEEGGAWKANGEAQLP
jgi:molybdopterin synthase catalytic subunit